MGIPLFFPSLKFFKNDVEGIGHDRTMTSHPYCYTDPELEVKMRPTLKLGLSSHIYSPNVDMAEDAEAEMYWMQYADFYDWPHIQYFDNYFDLKEKLKSANLKKIHQDMMEEVELRKIQVTREWCDITNRILQ